MNGNTNVSGMPYGGANPQAGITSGSDTSPWGTILGDMGNILGTAGGLYQGYTSAQNSQNLINAGNAGFGMAQNAYNPTLYGMNGIGGTGFSVSSPAGGPASINANLGAFNPQYGNLASQAGQYGNLSMGLANTAGSGAQGAYQSALSSIMPQLQNMQSNLLSANNNSLFQRGQLGNGVNGQYGANGPVNLTTQSLGAGFAQQDLNAITAAQNQGLNFFNSNLQGAGALGNLGFGATNTGLGMIGAQNQMGMLPLQYAQMTGNQQLGAANANANNVMAYAGRGGVLGQGGGWGQLAGGLGAGVNGAGGNGQQGGNPVMNMFNQGRNLYNDYNTLFGGNSSLPGGGTSSAFGGSNATLWGGPSGADLGGAGTFDPSAAGYFDPSQSMDFGSQISNYGSDLGFNAAGGGAATGGVGDASSMGFEGAAETTGGAAGAGAFAGAGGDALGTSAAEAAGASFGAAGGGASAGSLLGSVGAGTAVLPLAAMYMFASGYGNGTGEKFDANYWKGLSNQMNAGPGSGQLTPGTSSALSGIQQNTQYQGARSQILQDLTTPGTAQQVPYSGAQLQQWGLTPQAIQQFRYDTSGAAGAAGEQLAQEEGIPEFSTASRQGK